MNILTEESRSQLVANSKRAEREKDGKTRYEKRVKSRVGTSTKQYNRINMNSLFKDNILTIGIEVNGETDNYIVQISYGGFLDVLYDELKKNDFKIDLRIIIRSLIIAFNKNDVYIHCSCPDFKYRFGYWATVKEINSGEPELIPSDETNPDNKLGPGCKHIMLVLSNTSWLIKVASVINNYIKYMEKFRKTQYDSIIYPAIYREKKPVQLSMIDDEEQVADNTQEINVTGSKLRREQPVRNPSIRKAREQKQQEPIEGQEEMSFEEEGE